MANKAVTSLRSIAKKLTVRYVKAAKMWVVTYPENGKNIQKWFDDKPTVEQIKELS